MNWVRAIAAVLVLWSGTAWAATLAWNANTEPDLAGYRVYQCSQTPCTKTSGKASPLATLGKTTSFNIGTPAVTTHYIITAYDFANNESSHGNHATFTAAGSPPPPSPQAVNLTVVGNPTTGPWGVSATTTTSQAATANVFLDGVLHHAESYAPYGFPADNGTTVTPGLFGKGWHTVQFVFYLQNTSSEIGRHSVTVLEGSPAPPAPATPAVSLTVGGNPATGPWGVSATITTSQDVMAHVFLDGVLHHVESHAPYGFPADNGTTLTPGSFGRGWHTVQFVFYLENTSSEIGRQSVTVLEGSPASPAPATPPVSLTVVGNPATGPWGVSATTTSSQAVTANVFLDGVLHHVESYAPYGFPADNGTTVTPGLFGKGWHTVQFVFYLQNTTSEIGRAGVIVLQGT